MCGGKVLRCLTDKIDDIKAEACKKEVYYFEKMEVRASGGSLHNARFTMSAVFTKQTFHTHQSNQIYPYNLPAHSSQVTDFKNDVLLAEACRQDVDKLCATVEPGAPSDRPKWLHLDVVLLM